MPMEWVLILVGIVVVLVGVQVHWGLYGDSGKVRLVTNILGKTGTTIFYVVCGLVFIIVGILRIAGIVD
jgi:hypothetical protein